MNLPQLLNMSSSYWSTCTLHAGVRLDIFTGLATGSVTASDLAGRLSCDRRGLEMLLNALTAMELLEADGNSFRCTDFSRKYLSRASSEYMGHIILHHHNLMEGWLHLDKAVKSGKSVRSRPSHDVPDDERENFLMGMFNLASQIAPDIAVQIDLSGRRRLLDLAGGPGTYAIQFCKHNPELTAVIYDLPTTRQFAEKTIEKFGMSERISFVAGDITTDEPGNGYDVIWISHLLHSENPENSNAIIEKAAKSLVSGGLLFIQEFILDNDRCSPLFPALFSLNMLVATPAGQAYSQKELAGIMATAGLTDIQRLDINLPNGAGIMTGKAV